MKNLPCHYCGKRGGTIDHKVPISRGGEDKSHNSVPCCPPCNSQKGDMTYDEFMAARKVGKFPKPSGNGKTGFQPCSVCGGVMQCLPSHKFKTRDA